MVYISLRSLLDGIGLGLVIAVVFLVLATMWLEPRTMRCAPSCTVDAATEMSMSLQRAKLKLFEQQKPICMKAGEAIDGSYLIQNASISSFAFKCDSWVCSSDGTIALNESRIVARSDSVFNTRVECAGAAGTYSCSIFLLTW